MLDDKPEMFEAGMPYWEAFHSVSHQRPIGGMGGGGAIRREAVTDYLNARLIFDPVERERFRFYIEQMDGEYLTFQAQRIEKETPKVPGAGKVR